MTSPTKTKTTIFTHKQLVRELKEIKDHDGTEIASELIGGCDRLLFQIIKGQRNISTKSAKRMGYEKITLFRKIS
jgi:hypothetical protein